MRVKCLAQVHNTRNIIFLALCRFRSWTFRTISSTLLLPLSHSSSSGRHIHPNLKVLVPFIVTCVLYSRCLALYKPASRGKTFFDIASESSGNNKHQCMGYTTRSHGVINTFISKMTPTCGFMCLPRVKISLKCQGPFGPLGLKKLRGLSHFSFLRVRFRYGNEPTFSMTIWSLGLNILLAHTKFYGQLASGPASFWPLMTPLLDLCTYRWRPACITLYRL